MPKTNTPLLTYPFKSQQIFPNIQTMKNKASKFLKNLFSVVVTLVKAKSLAMRTKTAGLKARFLILGLLNSKKVPMTTISHKMHAFLSNERDQQHSNTSTHNGTNFAAYEGAMVPRKAQMNKISTPDYFEDMDLGLFEEGDGEYPDLTHSLFNSDDEEENGELELAASSITDFVKSSCKDGSNFNLEDEIDQVADVFIRKVLRQRRLQHQDSLERSQEMNA